MKILGVIPARGGSKGIPKKNIIALNGKPLIGYTIEAAQCSALDHVVVSTDDDDIAAVAQQLGCEVVRRPSELAQDRTPTLPVIQHAVEAQPDDYDAVMTLQPTSPLRAGDHINAAIRLFSSDSSADSLVSVVAVSHQFGPQSLMVRDGAYVKPVQDGNLILRRQDKQTYVARNGAAIYITRIDQLKHYIFGGKILGYEMSKLTSLDVDDAEDLELVRCLLVAHRSE